jgi:hypothetical protein
MLIPAVVAVPAFANCAMSEVVHWVEDVFAVQLVFVYHAVDAAAFDQTTVAAFTALVVAKAISRMAMQMP